MSKTLARSAFLVLAGLVGGVVLVVACGDDTLMNSDAASPCDCEPPLEGRIVRMTDQIAIDSIGVKAVSAPCSAGGILLGGGCQLMNYTPGIHLKTATPAQGGPPEGFFCEAENTIGPATETLVATAICLMPASM